MTIGLRPYIIGRGKTITLRALYGMDAAQVTTRDQHGLVDSSINYTAVDSRHAEHVCVINTRPFGPLTAVSALSAT